jgi:TDG/mug DNA glycosylase family protein
MPRPIATDASYLVPDLLAPGLRLVFCGTAPSKKSAEARAYYAKSGNRFWPTLHQVGITSRRFQPQEYRELLALKIGLTDLCKDHCGVDAELPDGAFDVVRFRQKMLHYQPAMIAFTSKNAGATFLGHAVAYGVQPEMLGNSRLFVLPSPSGLATRFFDLQVWETLAGEVQRL